MKRFFIILFLSGLAGLCASGMSQTAVSNVRASQRTDGSKLVDVYYDLASTSALMAVGIILSGDDGQTWNFRPIAAVMSGDIGSSISSGMNKHIVWDANRDKPGMMWPKLRAQVWASSSGDPQPLTVCLPGGVALEMAAIPPGSFEMGAGIDDQGWCGPDEYLTHTVEIAHGFHMGKYEVTQQQWLAVMGNKSDSRWSCYGVGDKYPAYSVSWNDIRGADGFIERLNRHIAATSQGRPMFRLPSEAEWEYACRAGSTTRFGFGNSDCNRSDCTSCDLENYAWYCGNNSGSCGQSKYGSKPVGGKLPNAFGLFDMHGNLMEWCEDWHHKSYSGAPADGSAWLNPPGTCRVVRGGNFDYAPKYCRSAYRCPAISPSPSYRYGTIGFRVVR
ncbi:MAG: formylglycine-generating enzyme family protein [Candidatus Sumerlaeota bacterium]|nr:formylglycine-generating enzyme family protein [Candidatus Sumerlaeota bacterium]